MALSCLGDSGMAGARGRGWRWPPALHGLPLLSWWPHSLPQVPSNARSLGRGPAGSGSPPASAPRALCAKHLYACLTLGHIHAFSLTSPQSCKAGEMTTHFTDEKTEAQRPCALWQASQLQSCRAANKREGLCVTWQRTRRAASLVHEQSSWHCAWHRRAVRCAQL